MKTTQHSDSEHLAKKSFKADELPARVKLRFKSIWIRTEVLTVHSVIVVVFDI
jgi:hypothetical protein